MPGTVSQKLANFVGAEWALMMGLVRWQGLVADWVN